MIIYLCGLEISTLLELFSEIRRKEIGVAELKI